MTLCGLGHPSLGEHQQGPFWGCSGGGLRITNRPESWSERAPLGSQETLLARCSPPSSPAPAASKQRGRWSRKAHGQVCSCVLPSYSLQETSLWGCDESRGDSVRASQIIRRRKVHQLTIWSLKMFIAHVCTCSPPKAAARPFSLPLHCVPQLQQSSLRNRALSSDPQYPHGKPAVGSPACVANSLPLV